MDADAGREGAPVHARGMWVWTVVGGATAAAQAFQA
jgi:hypothetical protein